MQNKPPKIHYIFWKLRLYTVFLKFYVMISPGIDLYGIGHVKVDFILLQKMYVISILGRFVWTTSFVQYDRKNQINSRLYIILASICIYDQLHLNVSEFFILFSILIYFLRWHSRLGFWIHFFWSYKKQRLWI